MANWSPFKSDVEKFLRLCEIKNISRTAEKLGLTQSQLSKNLAQLESETGERLFIRKPQGIELTLFAKAMETNLLELRKTWNNKTDIEVDEEMLSGQFTVGMHASIAMRIFPQRLHPLMKQNPALNLQTEFYPSVDIARRVASLQLDVGFVINPLKNPDLVAKKIDTETVGIWGQKVPKDGILYYHPDMFMVQKTLKRFSGLRKVALMDYEVIAQTIRFDDQAVGLLPDPIAKRYGGLKLLHGKILEVNLNVIVHRERLQAKNLKKLFQALQV